MEKRTRRCLMVMVIISLLVALVPLGGVAGAGAVINVLAGGDIQAAINGASPGDTIVLAPGVYPVTSRINVTKSVTILGPQANVDPRPSAGTARTPGNSAAEAILDGGGTLSTIFRIAANDVVLNGLEVRNVRKDSNGDGDIIDSSSSSPVKYRPRVQYNIIHQSATDEGIQLRNVTDGLIEYNYVYDTTGDGINLCCGSTGGTIQFNEVHDIRSPDAGIYVYDATNTTIDGNLVYNVFNNDGIKLGNKGGSNASLTGGSILNNAVHNTRQDGIAVYMSNVTVERNEVHHSRSENGAIYIAWSVSNITVRHNTVRDNTLDTRKWGNPAGVMIGTGVNVATVSVGRNCVYGNTPNGVTNKAIGSLVAENNWWGDASGPSGSGPGIGDTVSANVDFTPWETQPVAGACGDNVPPETTATLSGTAGDNGWYKSSVDVTLTAQDNVDGSGVKGTYHKLDGGAQQTATSVAIDTEGIHTLEYWSDDNAGNVESPHKTLAVKIDWTAPAATVVTPVEGAAYLLGQGVSASYSCDDGANGSGVAACDGTVPAGSGIDTSSAGGRTFAVSALDNAGNSASESVGYTVWGVNGPFPPLQKWGKGAGQFKAGSTIPVKFQITGDAGLLTNLAGSVSIGSGTAPFRWDFTAQQYVANVKTAGADAPGSYAVTLAVDGVGSAKIAEANLR